MRQREDPRHNLRLTPALKARLAHAAIDNGRSVNAEILARLERSFEPDPKLQLADVFRQIASMDDDSRAMAVDHLVKAAELLVGNRMKKSV